MIIFQLIPKLYTVKNLKWVELLEDIPHPVVLNKWLSMNEKIQNEVRYLDKFVFNLKTKQFLLLAWSIIPKQKCAPYCKYIKSNKEIEEEYNFLIIKIRKYLEISDHDWENVSSYFLKDIEKNKIQYFKEFGINKKLWKKFKLDYSEISKSKEKKVVLNKWF